jgi:hypothetical protein
VNGDKSKKIATNAILFLTMQYMRLINSRVIASGIALPIAKRSIDLNAMA